MRRTLSGVPMSPMVGQPQFRRRPFGVRLYLAFAFAGVALITAGLAYLLVSESGQEAADEQLDEIATGSAFSLAGEIGDRPEKGAQTVLELQPRRVHCGVGLQRRRAAGHQPDLAKRSAR